MEASLPQKTLRCHRSCRHWISNACGNSPDRVPGLGTGSSSPLKSFSPPSGARPQPQSRDEGKWQWRILYIMRKIKMGAEFNREPAEGRVVRVVRCYMKSYSNLTVWLRKICHGDEDKQRNFVQRERSRSWKANDQEVVLIEERTTKAWIVASKLAREKLGQR